jgi:hypothetical protein
MLHIDLQLRYFITPLIIRMQQVSQDSRYWRIEFLISLQLVNPKASAAK